MNAKGTSVWYCHFIISGTLLGGVLSLIWCIWKMSIVLWPFDTDKVPSSSIFSSIVNLFFYIHCLSTFNQLCKLFEFVILFPFYQLLSIFSALTFAQSRQTWKLLSYSKNLTTWKIWSTVNLQYVEAYLCFFDQRSGFEEVKVAIILVDKGEVALLCLVVQQVVQV